MFQEVLMMQQGIFVDGELANTSELNSEILLEEILEHERGYILISEEQLQTGRMEPENT